MTAASLFCMLVSDGDWEDRVGVVPSSWEAYVQLVNNTGVAGRRLFSKNIISMIAQLHV